jgi:predicted permease
VQRLRHAFLVAQVATSSILLTAAALLAMSLDRVLAIPSGFRPDHVLTARVAVPFSSYRNGVARLAFAERLLDAIQREPGIVSAGVTTNVPFSGRDGKSAASVEGQPTAPDSAPHGIYSYGVGGDYFAAMGFTLRQGRFLQPSDPHRSDRPCVVDEAFARRSFADGRVLGRRLFMGSQPGAAAEAFTVVGVVGSATQADLTDHGGQGAVYYPYPHFETDDLFLVVRTGAAPETLAALLPRVVRTVDREAPVSDVRSMTTRLDDSLVTRRSPAVLAVGFAAVALLLTGLGTYGVVSYAVTQRRREIGLRMAVGAGPADILRQFAGSAARLVAVGVGLGMVGAWAGARALTGLLYGVDGAQAPLLAATLTLAAVCTIACLVPAARAARIPPTEALAED